MIRKIKLVCMFLSFMLVGTLIWSCSNAENTGEQTPAAEEAEVVTPESLSLEPADTTTIDTSAKQRPIVRQ